MSTETASRQDTENEDNEAGRPQNILAGKRGLVMGVANDRSIAWGIASAAAEQGAELAFTFQNEAMEKRVRPLAEKAGSNMLVPCDVSDEEDLDRALSRIAEQWGALDFVVHAIAFSDKSELDGLYLDTTRRNFLNTMDISVYSFTSVAQRAHKLMKPGGSLLTLSYFGAEQVMPHYNVMGVAKAALEASVRYLANDLGPQGIRVNAISAGPIKTLAASGIGDFRFILKWNELNSPLRRNITLDDVGRAGLFCLSDLGSGMTGEVLHIDAGYHTVGMASEDKAKESAELLNSL